MWSMFLFVLNISGKSPDQDVLLRLTTSSELPHYSTGVYIEIEIESVTRQQLFCENIEHIPQSDE